MVVLWRPDNAARFVGKGGNDYNELLAGGAGLATLRLDGFTHLALSEGQNSGSFTTVPFEIKQHEPLSLVVNAACESDATIAVEVLDGDTGQPIPGFTRDDCQPLTEDRLAGVVSFQGGDRLPLAGHRQLAFRFWLSCRAIQPEAVQF